MLDESSKPSLYSTVDLRRGTTMPLVDLTQLMYTSAGGSQISEEVGEIRCKPFKELYVRPQWIRMTQWNRRWPLDRLGRKQNFNQILQDAKLSQLTPCFTRGLGHHAFGIISDKDIGRSLFLQRIQESFIMRHANRLIRTMILLLLVVTAQLSLTRGAKYIYNSPYRHKAKHLNLARLHR